MPRTTVTVMNRRNDDAVVATDRPDGVLAGHGAQDQQDRRRADERQDRQRERLARLGVDRRPLRRVGPDAEVGGEQPAEEHHLGGDEQQHPEDGIADAPVGVMGHRRERVVLDGQRRGIGRHRHRSVSAPPSGRGGGRTAVARSGSRAGDRSCTAGGGDEVAHSRVLPSHGSSPAIGAAAQRQEDVPQEHEHARGDGEPADRREQVEVIPAGGRGVVGDATGHPGQTEFVHREERQVEPDEHDDELHLADASRSSSGRSSSGTSSRSRP